MKLEVQGVNGAINDMLAQVRRVNKATARGITLTSREVVSTIKMEMLRVFNTPLKPYVLNAFSYTPADANDRPMRSEIYLKRDPQYRQHPLYVQIKGGVRSIKRFERSLQAKGVMPKGWFAVPTAAAAPNGRMTSGLVQQVLSAAMTEARAQNAHRIVGPVRKGEVAKTARRVRDAAGRAGGRFRFVMPRKGLLAPGIYLDNGVYLKKMFTYTPKVHYSQRLDFYGIAQRIIAQRLRRNIELSFFT